MRRRLPQLARYSAGSVIAGIISELTFLVAYALGARPQAATVLAFVAGAVPNYVLNRRWTWGRKGRADLAREVLPYVAIILTTATVAALVTATADGWVTRTVESRTLQVALVGGAFLLTYGVMFVAKFVLFDRFVFSDRRSGREPARG